jgi:hypothetical protein
MNFKNTEFTESKVKKTTYSQTESHPPKKPFGHVVILKFKSRLWMPVFVGVLTTLTLLAACSSFSTLDFAESDASGTHSEGRINGLLYYLPQGRIRIVGSMGSAPTSTQNTAGGVQSNNDSNTPSVSGSTPKQTSQTFTIAISADIEADHTKRFYLKPDRNYFYDDSVHIATNPKQLLSSGTSTANDETAAIIVARCNSPRRSSRHIQR